MLRRSVKNVWGFLLLFMLFDYLTDKRLSLIDDNLSNL